MIKIIAHRGFSKKYPENTLLAFNRAFENNADGIECDIQRSKDGHYIIIHDYKINVNDNSQKKVNELTLNELKKIDFGNGQQILELNEMLSSLPKHKIINIELKKDTLTEVDLSIIWNIINNYKQMYNIIISSFSDKLLYYFKKQKIKIGFLFGQEHKDIGFCRLLKILIKLNPDYFNIPIQIFNEFPKILCYIILFKLKLLRKKIIFWVVNTEAEFKKVKYFSDMIITDDPKFISKILFKD